MNKKKIEQGSIAETSLEIAPFAVQLLDPEIVSNPKLVLTKALVGIVTHFTTKLFSEYKEKIREGILKKDDIKTEKPFLILTDLMEIIDEGKINAERFVAMKSIFFCSVELNTTNEGEQRAYELLQTAKQLSSAEILILRGTYDVVKNTGRQLDMGIEWGSNRRAAYWAEVISKKIGHNLPELVLQHEANLIALRLITDYEFARNNTEIPKEFLPSQYFRLTALGYKLCEFMTKYE